MHSFWKKVGALCLAAAAIAASVAIATAATGGNDKPSARGSAGGFKAAVPVGPDEHLSALAKELGVSSGDLRDALDAVREKLGPPKRPSGPPSRAGMEKRCNEITDALASKLGKSGDEVRAATKKVMKAEIADAVKDKRLTQSQADKILEHIDSAACLPAFGPGHGGHCGPPPGARRGSDRGESVMPAPQSGGPTTEFVPAA
jgi:hypothetical protein